MPARRLRRHRDEGAVPGVLNHGWLTRRGERRAERRARGRVQFWLVEPPNTPATIARAHRIRVTAVSGCSPKDCATRAAQPGPP